MTKLLLLPVKKKNVFLAALLVVVCSVMSGDAKKLTLSSHHDAAGSNNNNKKNRNHNNNNNKTMKKQEEGDVVVSSTVTQQQQGQRGMSFESQHAEGRNLPPPPLRHHHDDGRDPMALVVEESSSSYYYNIQEQEDEGGLRGSTTTSSNAGGDYPIVPGSVAVAASGGVGQTMSCNKRTLIITSYANRAGKEYHVVENSNYGSPIVQTVLTQSSPFKVDTMCLLNANSCLEFIVYDDDNNNFSGAKVTFSVADEYGGVTNLFEVDNGSVTCYSGLISCGDSEGFDYTPGHSYRFGRNTYYHWGSTCA